MAHGELAPGVPGLGVADVCAPELGRAIQLGGRHHRRLLLLRLRPVAHLSSLIVPPLPSLFHYRDYSGRYRLWAQNSPHAHFWAGAISLFTVASCGAAQQFCRRWPRIFRVKAKIYGYKRPARHWLAWSSGCRDVDECFVGESAHRYCGAVCFFRARMQMSFSFEGKLSLGLVISGDWSLEELSYFYVYRLFYITCGGPSLVLRSGRKNKVNDNAYCYISISNMMLTYMAIRNLMSNIILTRLHCWKSNTYLVWLHGCEINVKSYFF